ncbi:MAG: sensor histidine kinase, partial [Chthoniobacterales bacterium]
QTLHPEDRVMAEESSKASLRGERDYDSQFRILRANGEVRTIKADALTIRDQQGKAIRQIGVNIDITERKKAEEELLRSLREKETLLRELYHRTKNTMQVVRGMVLLHAEKYPGVPEVKELAASTETRIEAISLVHQMLYQSQDLSRIDIGEYIRGLAGMVLASFGSTGGRIAMDFDIAAKALLLDSAIPLGLVLNELLTNSLKYAFPGDRAGTVSIALAASTPGKLRLTYRDDGIGLPESFDFRSQGSLGLSLVHGIGEQQMMGSVEFRGRPGVCCTFDFPEGLYGERV